MGKNGISFRKVCIGEAGINSKIVYVEEFSDLMPRKEKEVRRTSIQLRINYLFIDFIYFRRILI
jgi:hypothetical protein